ncbi:MAG: chemotaxis protein CheD [Candidatus Hermodarchaeota archaeon]
MFYDHSIRLLESEIGRDALISCLRKKGIEFAPEHKSRVIKRLGIITVRFGFKDYLELLNHIETDEITFEEIIKWLEKGRSYDETTGLFSPLIWQIKKDDSALKKSRKTKMKRSDRRIKKPITHSISSFPHDFSDIEHSSEKEKYLDIGEIAIGHFGDLLKITSLGSCIALVLYPLTITEPRKRFAVMSHIMLPYYPSGDSTAKKLKEKSQKWHPEKRYGPAKYANKAVPLMINILEKHGYHRKYYEAKLVGGARMFNKTDLTMEIGKENVHVTKNLLESNEIPLSSYYTGGDIGMNITFSVKDYKLIVKPTGGAAVIF